MVATRIVVEAEVIEEIGAVMVEEEEVASVIRITKVLLLATILFRLPDVSEFECLISKVGSEDLIAVKIRGLPYQVRYNEITDLFRQYKYIEKSAILGVGSDGRKNGFGSILFENADQA